MHEHLIIKSEDEGTLMPSFRDKIYKVTWRESKNKELEFKKSCIFNILRVDIFGPQVELTHEYFFKVQPHTYLVLPMTHKAV